jgi:hypothetical protein
MQVVEISSLKIIHMARDKEKQVFYISLNQS